VRAVPARSIINASMTGITAMDFELPEELKLLKRTVRTSSIASSSRSR
jgi:hypothetical protein